MNDDKNITDEALTANADGGEAVLSQSNLSLEELNAQLGKNFPTKEAAMKSIADTFSYVGKKKEDIAKEFDGAVDSSKFVSREEFNNQTFYAEHPELKPYKEILSKLDSDPYKAAQNETFKSIYEKASSFEKIETSKSVLHSNPRLSKATDSMQEARELASKGSYTEASNKAVNGLIDALGL